MITIRVPDILGIENGNETFAKSRYFPDDYPLGLEDDAAAPAYLTALAADASSYTEQGNESHLWIG